MRAKDHDGKEYTYEGVILRTAGVKPGEQLRGKTLATCLLVTAANGYEAVFALAGYRSVTNNARPVATRSPHKTPPKNLVDKPAAPVL